MARMFELFRYFGCSRKGCGSDETTGTLPDVTTCSQQSSKRRKTDDRPKAEAEFTRQQEVLRKAENGALAAGLLAAPADNTSVAPMAVEARQDVVFLHTLKG